MGNSLLLHYQFNYSNAPYFHDDLGGLFVSQLFYVCATFTGPIDQHFNFSLHPGIGGTDRQTTQQDMHEIACSMNACFETDFYYWACDWISRIRSAVWLWWRPAAPTQCSITVFQALMDTQFEMQVWDVKDNSFLFYFTYSHYSLPNPSLRWVML